MKNLPYTAETDIEGYRLVTFGTNDGEVKPTTGHRRHQLYRRSGRHHC